jgi:hypothetical protein
MSASSSGYQDDIARALKSNAEIKELLSKPRASLGGKPPSTAASASPGSPVQTPAMKPSPMVGGMNESEAVNQLKSTIEGLLRDLGRALMEKQKVEVGIRNSASIPYTHDFPMFLQLLVLACPILEVLWMAFSVALIIRHSKKQNLYVPVMKTFPSADSHMLLTYVWSPVRMPTFAKEGEHASDRQLPAFCDRGSCLRRCRAHQKGACHGSGGMHPCGYAQLTQLYVK